MRNYFIPVLLACFSSACESGSGVDYCPTETLSTPQGVACGVLIKQSIGRCNAAGSGSATISAEDARCVLTALRDRTIGVVKVNRTPDGGFCGVSDEIHIAGDEVWVVHSEYRDLNRPENSFGALLKPPSFYQSCLDGTDEKRIACFDKLFTPNDSCPGNCCEE